MRTANPTMKSFEKEIGYSGGRRMTLMGAVHKSFLLLFILVVSAGATWYYAAQGDNVAPMMMIGAIGGLIFALITSFAPKASPITAPIYAVLEGMFVGGISAYYSSLYEGIVMQAVLITMGVFLGLLLIYRSGLIKVTQNFRLGVAAATLGVFMVYLISFVLGLFGIAVPFLHESNTIGIIISLVIIVIAALNLVLDFDFIEHGAARGLPKHMEWYAGFALLVTLVWLYLEILRLLSKINSRS
ncbi:Bax inhibitor-1/YccA family protein [Bacillus sp. FJAT-42376]|uniref:Bax inhibitor-1/YccA family protein n=1 Tax=Bacillus sp. FJAT-42376 TaxID=2014076 RepID=UPI000F514A21|nr:Bax inhibitor-1/YccA family protein [Bacillus sp. FJAT-42376]AZB42496.1 Bax inhibitor-1/YccA family protein [Bacillus sp. FJAT-42376]